MNKDIEYAIHFGGMEIRAGFDTIAEAKAHITKIQTDGRYADAYVVRYTGINSIKVERIS